MSKQNKQQIGKNQPVRQRITPTFIHHNIFAQNNSDSRLNVRYTPTFASTVMDYHGYSEKIIHQSIQKMDKQKVEDQLSDVIVENLSKERKIADLNPCCTITKDLNRSVLVDPKVKVMEEINFMGGRTSRMRKIVEMMSNPIFSSGYFWSPNNNKNLQNQEKNEKDNQQRLKKVKSLQKLKTDQSNEQDQTANKKSKNRKSPQKNDKNKQKSKIGSKVPQNKDKNSKQLDKGAKDKTLNRYKSAANIIKKTRKF